MVDRSILKIGRVVKIVDSDDSGCGISIKYCIIMPSTFDNDYRTNQHKVVSNFSDGTFDINGWDYLNTVWENITKVWDVHHSDIASLGTRSIRLLDSSLSEMNMLGELLYSKSEHKIVIDGKEIEISEESYKALKESLIK